MLKRDPFFQFDHNKSEILGSHVNLTKVLDSINQVTELMEKTPIRKSSYEVLSTHLLNISLHMRFWDDYVQFMRSGKGLVLSLKDSSFICGEVVENAYMGLDETEVDLFLNKEVKKFRDYRNAKLQSKRKLKEIDAREACNKILHSVEFYTHKEGVVQYIKCQGQGWKCRIDLKRFIESCNKFLIATLQYHR